MEYKALVSSARKTFNAGRTKDVKFRIKQLKGLVQMYKENEALFLEALKKDLRKPKQESIVSETDFCINDALGMIYEVEEWSKPVNVKRPPVNMMDGCMIKPEPLGVALVIGAWNYPLNLTMGPVTGAIAAGNCVIIKPSELSPNTANAIMQLLPKYVDPECYKVVCGGVPETTELLKVSRYKLLQTFTKCYNLMLRFFFISIFFILFKHRNGLITYFTLVAPLLEK